VINFDKLIPDGFRRLSKKNLRFLRILIEFGVPQKIGVRGRGKEKYFITFTIDSWGKYRGDDNKRSRRND